MQADVERCRREMAGVEELLRAGHPDIDGLCLALADWRGELNLIEAEAEHTDKEVPPMRR